MKVAIYARVSTDDKGQDPLVQENKCRAYCEIQGHEVVAVFYEEGVSGDTFYYDRPKGKELFNLIQSNKIQGLVVQAVDRFSRQNPLKVLQLLNNLRTQGIVFISVTEPAFNMDSEFSDVIRYILTWFNNYFLKQHKVKVNAGLDKARKYGTKSGKAIGRERKADHQLILQLHEQGLTISEIARQTGVLKGSVKYAIDSKKRPGI
jgi:DNA invertase Pin-like site-specific DNA recombinase